MSSPQPPIVPDTIIRSIGQLITNSSSAVDSYPGVIGHHSSGDDWSALGVLPDAAVACSSGKISWLGPMTDLEQHVDSSSATVIDAEGRAVIPGLVDCHTHVVHAGKRVDEFAMRCRGASYEEIAAAGGGIRASTRMLRQASLEELIDQSAPRLQRMLARGVTTVEIKSGYGLDLENELKMLRAIDHFRRNSPQTMVATALPAHALPDEYQQDRAGYLQLVLDSILPEVARNELASFVDVFVERGAFTPEETRRIAQKAEQLGLGLKLHVDQLSAGGGAELAAELRAFSADHLEYTSDSGARALAQAGTIAVILPICPLYLGKGPFPDGRRLADAGCRVAVSTDCNPGSAVCDDLWLAATIAATKCGLSLPEAFQGITLHAAASLGLDQAGRIAPGCRADMVILDADDWREPLYQLAAPPPWKVFARGNDAEVATKGVLLMPTLG